ncbi:poly-beta-1,6-N-acetyl-D-glucosamine biosynthesis protein PgaD [Halothiobacillus diazotrophicus]|uniref:Poly-beta-1,6-N-acetyl-D-glucosamine biosynthesis protein PgaD n=1 Tax=Halothiobacillus diazotrophicus TaxID=1860122 RepID=A0A191ZH78_9GAMM|nr:poly-beta-1,6-N-acetyl-D-glucosamine biosynthesis protein PgaD [Halothiobacillus diazotrophicus]
MPRPRIPEIIHRPDLVTASRKGVMALIATIGWMIWLYLISPLSALFAWWFGYDRMNLFVLSDPAHTIRTLMLYAMVIAAGGALFILWAVYNWLRFRRVDRRRVPETATEADIASAFAIPTQSVLDARGGKVLAFNFDDHGQIMDIETTRALSEKTPAGTPASKPLDNAASETIPHACK